MIRELMSSGVPSWVPARKLPLKRAGYLEESYFRLWYVAVDDEEGVIRGMLCVCSEVTEQIVSAANEAPAPGRCPREGAGPRVRRDDGGADLASVIDRR